MECKSRNLEVVRPNLCNKKDLMSFAFRVALAAARKGDTLLFSPAFASFSHEFKNEYERGDKFQQIINEEVKNKK